MGTNSSYRTGSKIPSLATTLLTQKEKTMRRTKNSRLVSRLMDKRSRTRKLSPLGGRGREITAGSIKMWS